MASRPEFRNYRLKLIVWMIDSRDLKDAESVRSGLSHVPSQPALLPPFRDPGGTLSRKDEPPNIWVDPPASSSSPYTGGFNPWIPCVTEHIAPHVMSENQTPALHPRCQSGPSARNSLDTNVGRFSKDMEQTNKDCRFRMFILTNSLLQPPLFVGRKDSRLRYVLVHNFSPKLCQGSKKWRWLDPWVISNLRVLSEDLVEQTFELLDSRIASALNKIIQSTRFKKKSQSGGNENSKRGAFPQRKTDRLPDVRVLPGHWGQRFCRELQLFFEMMIFRNSIRSGMDFYSR